MEPLSSLSVSSSKSTSKADLSAILVDCAYKVHSQLGPGLLENTYEKCLEREIQKRNLKVESQKALPVFYDNIKIDVGYRIDLWVEDCFIIEVKAVERMIPLYQAQLMTYLKLSKIKTGLLINFNAKLLKDGIQRISI